MRIFINMVFGLSAIAFLFNAFAENMFYMVYYGMLMLLNAINMVRLDIEEGNN